MRKVIRFAVRTTVLGGLAVGALAGGTALFAGPDRAHAMFDELRGQVHSAIDSSISDPVAMRAKLRRLESEYPERIAELSGDLAEVRDHVGKVVNERRVSDRVVELADLDIKALETQVARLSSGQEPDMRSASNIAMAQDRHDLAQAKNRLNQVRQTRLAYSSRASETERELTYLDAQEQRLTDALGQLELEHAQFQTQLDQIERQVDAIERNSDMIAMMKKRQRALDEIGRYEAISLDGLVGSLAEVRSRQEAELDVLTISSNQMSYEDFAKMELQAEAEGQAVYEGAVTFESNGTGLLMVTPSQN